MEYNTQTIKLMADISYKSMQSAKYGGNIFDYLDDFGIENFDVYSEGEGIQFISSLFANDKRNFKNCSENYA